jgi:hypothetical protein
MRAFGIASLLTLGLLFVACSDGDEDGGGSAGGAGRGGGTIDVGGSSSRGGGASAGESSSSGGSSRGGTSAAAGTSSASGGDSSGVPVGGICALDENCSQAEDAAVCCEVEGCGAPCECTLAEACPTNPSYLPCESAADCEQFGGGRVCCDAGSMTYCTKPSGCLGEPLP